MQKITTLLQLSKLFNVKKATLIFYYQLGLFKPLMFLGKMALFDEKKAIKSWKYIEKLKKEGKTLAEIREIYAKK